MTEEEIYKRKGRNTISKLEFLGEGNYANDIYMAWITYRDDNIKQITISRKDGDYVESWYDMWNIKNQLFDDNTFAIEVYPSRNCLIDGQNQRHLFIIPDNQIGDVLNKIDISDKRQG